MSAESELRAVLEAVAVAHSFDAGQTDAALDLMRDFYNGYRFSTRREERLYNPTLALYFLKHWARQGAYPARLLDDNLAMDRNRIQYVARLPHGENLVNRALDPAEPLAVAQLAFVGRHRAAAGANRRQQAEIGFEQGGGA